MNYQNFYRKITTIRKSAFLYSLRFMVYGVTYGGSRFLSNLILRCMTSAKVEPNLLMESIP